MIFFADSLPVEDDDMFLFLLASHLDCYKSNTILLMANWTAREIIQDRLIFEKCDGRRCPGFTRVISCLIRLYNLNWLTRFEKNQEYYYVLSDSLKEAIQAKVVRKGIEGIQDLFSDDPVQVTMLKLYNLR